MVFNRQVDDIRISQYIDPGVEDNSVARGLAAVGEGALRIDQKVGEGALRNELTAMETLYKSSSSAVTDKPALDLTEADLSEIMSSRSNIAKMQRAVSQGSISFDQYRLFAESSLRAAIARRPGLASEYRQLASDTLGTDVSGAAVEFLAAKEAEINRANAARVAGEVKSAADEDARLGEDIRATMESTTMGAEIMAEIAFMSDAEVAAFARDNPLVRDMFLEVKNSKRREEESKRAASITTNEITATQLSTQDQWTARISDIGATYSGLAFQVQEKLKGGLTEEETLELREIMSKGRQYLLDFKTELLNANGRVDRSFYESAVRTIEEMEASVGLLVSDANNMSEAAIKLFVSQATQRANKDPAFSYVSLIRNTMGDAAANTILGTLSKVEQEAVALSAQDATGRGMPPDVANDTNVNYISGLTTRIATLKEGELTESMRQLDANMLKRRVGLVIQVPANQWKPARWIGPQGAIVRLSGNQGKAIYEHLPEAERPAVGALMLDANRYALDGIRTLWEKERRGEATFELREDGTFIQPKDPAQVADARRFESTRLNGKAALDATMLWTGMDSANVRSYLNRTGAPAPVQAAATSVTNNAPASTPPAAPEVANMSADAEWFNTPLPGSN